MVIPPIKEGPDAYRGIIPNRESSRQIIDNGSRQRYLSIPSPQWLSLRVNPSVPSLSCPRPRSTCGHRLSTL